MIETSAADRTELIPAGWEPVELEGTLSEGVLVRGHIYSDSVVLVRIGQQTYCVSGICPHAGGPLAEGTVENLTLACPWHHSRFDLQSGAALTSPAVESITSYDVQMAGSTLIVRPRQQSAPQGHRIALPLALSPTPEAPEGGGLWMVGDAPPADEPRWVGDSQRLVEPYLTDFLCAPHPYRDGRVCPFMPGALGRRQVFFATAASQDLPIRVQAEHVFKLVTQFALRKQRYGALVILFPADAHVERMLDLHARVKTQIVKNYFMVGGLFSGSEAASIHRTDYFPLRTPVPTLVVRDMVTSDLRFLDPKNFSVYQRIRFLKSFIRRFGDTVDRRSAESSDFSKARELYKQYILWCFRRGAASLFVVGVLGWVAVVRRSRARS